MAGRYGSLSRALLSTARTATLRSTPSISLLRSPTLLGQRLQSRRLLSGILPRLYSIATAAAQRASGGSLDFAHRSGGALLLRIVSGYLKFIAVDVSKQTLQ